MLKILTKTKFEKDLKRVLKRGKQLDKMEKVVKTLAQEEPLPKKYCDHQLVGNYKDCRECHIEPDWLLVYMIDGDELLLVRTGSHSDLFK